MSCLTVFKYAVFFIIIQFAARVVTCEPKDTVPRRGIILKFYSKEECKQLNKDEVSIDGIMYKRYGVKREKSLENERFLAHLYRFVQSSNPRNGFDLMVLTRLSGERLGEVITGAKLIKLVNDDDLDDAVILMSDPPGLEFVKAYGYCSFIRIEDNKVSRNYYCGNDNYHAYP